MTIQTQYLDRLTRSRVGHLINTELHNLFSRTVEGTDAVPFGVLVTSGTAARTCVAAAAGDSILGITVRDLSTQAASVDTFGQYEEANICDFGTISVVTDGTAVEGDPAFYTYATGQFGAAGDVEYGTFRTSTTTADEIGDIRVK